MSADEKLHKVMVDLGHGGFWSNWMPLAQRQVIAMTIKDSDERDWFIERLTALRTRIEQMPQTYQTKESEEEYKAYLKYFGGPVTAYICEKDRGEYSYSVWTPETVQVQAFGQTEILPNYPEMGYIYLPEILDAGIELDLHFEPKLMSEIKES